MPVVPMREILDRAFAERYGVAAINVVDDLTLEAVLAAATDLEAPLIVQTSLKTVKSLGAAPLLRDLARARRRRRPSRSRSTSTTARTASGSRRCLEAGWNSVLFDGSELDVAENTRQTIEVVAEAERHGAQVEGEIESVHGRRGRRSAPTSAGEVHPVEVSAEFIAATGVYSFAPAIGTAHGLYKAEPHLMPERVTEIVAAAPDPDGPARRHRPHRGAVHRPDRARLRQGQHLDRAQDRLRRRAPRVPRGESRQARPAGAAQARARGGEGDGRAPHPHLRLGRARPGRSTPRPPEPRARADLRLRRRPRRHRARRPPPRLQPGVRRGGHGRHAGTRRSTAAG